MRPLSARNPRITRLVRLVKSRAERDDQRALVVEGAVLVSTALEAGVTVREMYVDEARADGAAITALLATADGDATLDDRAWSVPPGVLDRVGDVSTSQGILAVVDRPEATWPTPLVAPFVVVLAGLQMPGNVGTLVRAAVAAGAGAVVAVGGADPSSPKVVRSSAGSVFQVDVVTVREPSGTPTDAAVLSAITRLRADGYRVAAAVVAGGEPHHQADLDGPIALVLGSEAHGLSEAVVAASDLKVTIAMAGPTESLNVAMAGTVLCFEVLRRRIS